MLGFAASTEEEEEAARKSLNATSSSSVIFAERSVGCCQARSSAVKLSLKIKSTDRHKGYPGMKSPTTEGGPDTVHLGIGSLHAT